MNKSKKLSVKPFAILWAALLLISCGREQPSHSMAEDTLKYDSIYAEQAVRPADPEKRKEYQRDALENSLQNTIRAISEDIEPTVSIENLFAEDRSETTASVTLCIKQGQEISEEHLRAIEKMVAGSIEEIPQENISITIEHEDD